MSTLVNKLWPFVQQIDSFVWSDFKLFIETHIAFSFGCIERCTFPYYPPGDYWSKMVAFYCPVFLYTLHTKKTICWTKGLSLLTSVDTRTNLPFYGMIARTNSYVFTVIFLAVFPLEPAFLACAVYVLHYVFQNRIRAAQIDGFIEEYCGEYSLWRQHENDVTFLFGY